VRAPGRSGLVIGALAATVGLLASTAGFIKSTREAISEWVDEKIAADLFVTSGSSLTSGGNQLQMRDDAGEKLREHPAVAAALPVRFLRVDYRNPAGRDCMVFVIGIDTKAFRESDVTAAMAKNMQRYVELGLGEPGTVLVSENFAALHKVKVGDTITFPGGKGMVTARVAGLATDYTWNRGTIIMDLSWLRREYDDQQVDVYDVFLKPGYDADEVREELLAQLGDEYVLFAATRPEVNREVSSTLNKIYAIAYAQQTIVGIVALLGVVSALFISVLQRQREVGLLRAVGATRAQILRSVLAEAVLMGLIGAVVGFGIGLLLEWYILNVMILDESGFQFALRVPWLEAGALTVGAVLLATLAGLWPAYQATRLRIPEAIAYE
jgi:putative ABC transport system permease protein